MSEIIQSFDFETKEVRIIGDSKYPWFLAKDICNILELSNVSQAVAKLPEKWKGIYQHDTLGGKQNMITISEAGVYKLIMRSDKIQSQKFQEWVCEDLLPKLRLEGEYKMGIEYQNKVKELEDLGKKIKIMEEENSQIKQQKKLLENKVLRTVPRVQYKDRNVIYMITSDYHLKNRTYMIGKAVNLTDRLSSYDRTMDHKAVFYGTCNNSSQMRIIELMVLTILDKYREVKSRDRFVLPDGEDISLFSNVIESVINLLKDSETVDIQENYTDEEKLKFANEQKVLYREDNKENIIEQRKNYRDNNKEHIALQQKIFYEKNKDKYSEKNQVYRDNNKEKIAAGEKVYYEENKTALNIKTKIWKENNKERMVENSKQYYQTNLEEIQKKKKIKVICECGNSVNAAGMLKHKKTKIHKELMIKKINIEIVEEEPKELNDEHDELKEELKEELNEELKEESKIEDVVESKLKTDVEINFEVKKVDTGRVKGEKTKEKSLCDCGIKVVKYCLPRHLQSKIHENFMKLKQNIISS